MRFGLESEEDRLMNWLQRACQTKINRFVVFVVIVVAIITFIQLLNPAINT